MADIRIQFLVTIWSLLAMCQAQVEEGAIRLSSNAREGIVEVYFEGQWGTISNVNLNGATPRVICEGLGFNGPVETMDETVFRGAWDIPVWRVECSETVSSILDCTISMMEKMMAGDYSVTDFEIYDHNNDLGVICQNSEAVNTGMFLAIDVVLFVLSLVCILLCAFAAYYCATRKEKPKPADKEGDAGYQSYNKPDATAPAYTGYIAKNESPTRQAATAAPSSGSGGDTGGYMDITAGYENH